ncbi:TPR repeat protein [Roseobacter sp. SK209-2-6]|uniref:O-linked N-acetylglucosamine transferase family protein n=1 Tax=Roseobacter sp. SK209-2-6 TaxID=388739 RepID=UPI0000F3C5A8|nr:tetratricopeptide repeat protein [Roseobacter sp. SK209-2-6]EBA18424.1 TPR repeat protein [Roseobacter sp. SK209-2-6]
MTIASSINKANRLERDNRFEDAAEVYRDILKKFPRNTRARSALDVLQNRISEMQNPSQEQMDTLKTKYNAGQHAEVGTSCASLLNGFRHSPFLWEMLGRCHLQAGNLNEAATCLNKACELAPRSPNPYSALGDVYQEQSQIDNAIALYKKAISLDPEHVNSLNNLANTYVNLGRISEALPLLETARAKAPQNALIAFNLGSAVLKTGQATRAKTLFEKAISLDPNLTQAHYNLAQLQSSAGEKELAIERFDAILQENPADDRTRACRLDALAQINDWRWLQEYQECRRHLGLTGCSIPAFTALNLEDNPDLLRLRIQAYANERFPAVEPAPPCNHHERPKKLRIGYFSSDFHRHATMHLMGGLFAAHDKARFEIYAYSYDAAPADAIRKRVQDAVTCFRDISTTQEAAILEQVKADKLDIAIDLKGFTGNNKSHLFAHRLAGIQISYLGFPATSGSTAFDYFIGDHKTCPPGSERFFEEHLIRMPNSYQANDNSRTISDKQYTRADCGLPDDGFVFCSFNNSYKITPREFDIWMRLLAQTDGSVLWLLQTSQSSTENFRQEAEKRGIDASRLIFAPPLPQAEHLARQQVADLFLDSFTVNAHTTGSDALWAGVPILTLPGKQFAARVGASLLHAVGLPEMIATSEADYEKRALELAHDTEAMAKIRGKLYRNRLNSPLFDTDRFARDLEKGFDLAFERSLKGQTPAHIDVPAAPLETPMPPAAALGQSMEASQGLRAG